MSQRFIQFFSAVLLVSVGILVGFKINRYDVPDVADERILSQEESLKKFQQVVSRVTENYFESVNHGQMVENAIVGMLKGLDPHTFYIPPADMQGITESMQGSFDGIGVEFNIVEDTIVVVSPISGGPSERLGIMPGDRIVEVEGSSVAGVGITNEKVVKLLRGPRGTTVNVRIRRPGVRSLMEFAIVRDKIPLNSVDFAYMIDAENGYIKVNRFAETTMQEFMESLAKLKRQGLKNLILDLRGNPGGYLEMAQMMADVFLKRGKMIVYTKGRIESSNREYVASTRFTEFEEGGLVVLINQGSASASEIVSGAVQDHDRGLVIGTRSFGKGLVQQQYPLLDGSAIRVVVSRYFTPSGRCIQKPFQQGHGEEYDEEVYERVNNGELFDASAIHFPDSLRYRTAAGRTVYGGGGIMPDVFVPADTTGRSDYLEKLVTKNAFRMFVFRWAESHQNMKAQYANGLEFARRFQVDEALLRDFRNFAAERDVAFDQAGYNTSLRIIKDNLKALIGRQWFNDEGFYPSLHQSDPTFQKALRLMPNAVELARTGRFDHPDAFRPAPSQSNNGR
jgi:carboxyl-terminal processing protease